MGPAKSGSRDHAEELVLEERRRRIRGLLEERARVTVPELSREFGVSTVTIRNDLAALDEIGALVRVHGGALPRRESDELPIDVKQSLHRAEKQRIATAAIAHIDDGATIVLDSGTTTAEIAKQIRGLKLASLNVITNALNIAVMLASVQFVNLVIPGGVLRRRSWSLSGPQAENAIRGLQADTFFLGVDSLDPEVGLMTPYVLEAQLNAEMIKISRRVIAVTDSSKLLRRNLSVIAPVDQVDLVITDRNADAKCVEQIRARGVDVELI